MKSEFKRLGEYLKASLCEVKMLYDEDDNETEKNVGSFFFDYDGQLFVADDETEKYVQYQGIERKIEND